MLNDSMEVVLVDFGFIDVIIGEEHSVPPKSQIRWLAPECLSEKKYSSKSDTWAWGITIWEVFNKADAPISADMVMNEVLHGNTPTSLKFPSEAPLRIIQAAISCWKMNPEERSSFGELQHLVENRQTVKIA